MTAPEPGEIAISEPATTKVIQVANVMREWGKAEEEGSAGKGAAGTRRQCRPRARRGC
jgi:hypothetical protein